MDALVRGRKYSKSVPAPGKVAEGKMKLLWEKSPVPGTAPFRGRQIMVTREGDAVLAGNRLSGLFFYRLLSRTFYELLLRPIIYLCLP